MTRMSNVYPFIAALSLAGALLWGQPALSAADAPGVPPVVRAVTGEVTKRNDDAGGRPLPVVSHWANGFNRPKFSSEYQISLLAKGHHVMPTLPFPRPGQAAYPADARPWVDKLARWRAPFSLRAGQWEQVLVDKKHPADNPGKWRSLPPDKSPLAVNAAGEIEKWISPWGAVEPWYEAGVYNTRSAAFAELQRWYPNPPLVILLSNNEARKLKAKHAMARQSKRFIAKYGKGASHAVLRKAMIEGYLPRYAALLKGVREGLKSATWRRNSLLVGYNAFGPPHVGRWDDWTVHSFATDKRIAPWPRVWEGGSPSYYTHNWNPSSDFRVWSPQVESQNWVFMLRQAYRDRPNFWFEISIWDGNPANPAKSKYGGKMDFYRKQGQTWSPARYAGFVQFGLWLLRPRVVREFRGSTVPLAPFRKDFEALVAAVDRVWADETLKAFWRRSELVPNRSAKHPYQCKIPAPWKDVDRWFMLDTSLDPPRPWKLTTELPVFALARVTGKAPGRRWLLYAHAPVKERKNVVIDVPGYGKATVDVTPGGSFHVIDEKSKSVTFVTSPPN